MTTVTALSSVNDILDTDLVMVTHSNGESYKITGENLKKAMAVDTVTSGNMKPVTSNAVSRAFTLSRNKTTIGEVLDDLGITNELYPFVRTAFANLISGISNYSTGVITVESGGPQFGFVLYKLNDNYFSAELLSYDANIGLPIIKITHTDGVYFNGVRYSPFI